MNFPYCEHLSDETHPIRTLDLEILAAAHACGAEIGPGVGFALQSLLCLLVLACHVFWGREDFPVYFSPQRGLRRGNRDSPVLRWVPSIFHTGAHFHFSAAEMGGSATRHNIQIIYEEPEKQYVATFPKPLRVLS